MPENTPKSLGAELQHLTVTYSHLFLRAADAFLIWDEQGVIQNANGASCLLTGYDRDQLLGMDHRKLFAGELHSMLDTLLQQCRTEEDGNILFEGERAILNRDSESIPVTLRFITVSNPGGANVLGIIHDIRDLKDLEARLAVTHARYKGIVENVQEIIFLLNDVGRIIFHNKAAEDLLGYDSRELMGREFRNIINTGQDELAELIMRKGRIDLDHSGHRPTLCLKSKDESVREFQFFASDIPDEWHQPGGLLLVMHDITEQRAIQEKLKHAQRMQSVENILGKITHEVKNPLAAISASAEFLQRHWDKADEEEKKEVIDLIAGETVRINKVITDYLRVRRVPNPTILAYDIADIVDTLERSVEQLLHDKPEIKLVSRVESHEVPLDVDMIKQVLWNLVNNAFDALEGEGLVEIIGEANADEQYYLMKISDNGCGMVEETKQRLFEPFFTRKETGTGLGMPMVRQHLDALNADLELESEPGKGTTFTIRFPLKSEN
jgi:PAS domain S-box-containing protein